MATLVRSGFRGILLLVCGVFAVASTAGAGIVSVEVTGEVTRSDFDTIGVGTLVTGLYTYDDTLAPDLHTPDVAWYRPVAATLGFADGSTISSNGAAILVSNDAGTPVAVDEYGVFLDAAGGRGTVTGAFAGTNWEFVIGAVLRHDPTGTAWDGIALPDPETVLALLPDDSSTIYFFESYGGSRFIDFRTTNLSIVAVPLPGALVLGVIGLSCCRRLCRRRAL